MEDLLKKISQYQLFNFLLSGALLAVLLKQTTSINLIYENTIAEFFAFYFIGLVISRVGSLIVEPWLKKLKIVTFTPYSEYLVAAKSDKRIDILSQENNTYRTLIATFLVFAAIYIVTKYAGSFIRQHHTLIVYIFMGTMLVLFTLAYHKQTNYIAKRIKNTQTK
ncbi:MAG TPA: hypothetical protein VLF39_02115 [Candidatus Saccharimonadales bacterium]|nr:hypothetical protein [Candidatus Saccharimonadales bacterium]